MPIKVSEIEKDMLYSTKEVAQILGISAQGVRRFVRLGKLKARKLGATYYISGAEILDFLKVEKKS